MPHIFNHKLSPISRFVTHFWLKGIIYANTVNYLKSAWFKISKDSEDEIGKEKYRLYVEGSCYKSASAHVPEVARTYSSYKDLYNYNDTDNYWEIDHQTLGGSDATNGDNYQDIDRKYYYDRTEGKQFTARIRSGYLNPLNYNETKKIKEM